MTNAQKCICMYACLLLSKLEMGVYLQPLYVDDEVVPSFQARQMDRNNLRNNYGTMDVHQNFTGRAAVHPKP